LEYTSARRDTGFGRDEGRPEGERREAEGVRRKEEGGRRKEEGRRKVQCIIEVPVTLNRHLFPL
jgi:hypothetical protein